MKLTNKTTKKVSKLNLTKRSSSLTYSMKNPVHAWTGICKDFTVEVDYDEKGTSILSVEVVAQADSFDSGIPKRDREALKTLGIRRFPTVNFVSENITQNGDILQVNGTLTFHGVSRPVSFNVNQKVAGKQLKAKGAFSVKLTDYDLKPPGYFLLKTDDNIDLKFNLVFGLA